MMLGKQSTSPAVKDISDFISRKSHVQKKYFSLMLVPSFSSGKTRSIKIPYAVFHFTIIAALIISATVFGFYMRSNYFENAAKKADASLSEAQEAYNALQADLENQQSQLLNGQSELKEQLTEAEISKQTEMSRQSQNYQDNLNGMQEQMEEMEQQLEELDDYRQEAFDKLEAKAYIPPVKNLLDGVSSDQIVSLSYVQSAGISSDERSGSSRVTESDLEDYFTVFNFKKESLAQNYTELSTAIEAAAPYIKNYPTTRPVNGTISSNFGYRTDPMGGRRRDYHDAIDIRCPTGSNVVATGGGTVSTSKWSGSYGYLIIIDHGFGIQTAYAHNSKLLVDVGDTVERGDIIAASGNTGNSTGPHVHYEVRVNGVTTDPANYFLE